MPGAFHLKSQNTVRTIGATSLIAAQPQTDILINGLGIYGAREFFEIDDALWENFFQVNIMSGVRLSRHYAKEQRDRRPEANPATAALAKAGHGLLYLAMLLLPITGVMIMIGNGYGWDPFGMELVAGGGAEIGWMATLGSVHSLIAWSLLILVAGHVGIALLHHFVKQDGVLQRML